MNQHQTDKRIRLPRRAWFIALVAIFAFAVASLPQLGSIVRAQEPDSNSGSQANTVPPPPGDCWGGALSDDPLHCYALEEAQRDGIIEVEGVYDASGELHIFFNYRTGPPVSALLIRVDWKSSLKSSKTMLVSSWLNSRSGSLTTCPFTFVVRPTLRKPTGTAS